MQFQCAEIIDSPDDLGLNGANSEGGIVVARVVVMGAAGRDFHNFNVYLREKEQYEVVAFTATQIPDIDDRRYPPDLAGRLYPEGIPIEAEEDLIRIIRDKNVDHVLFSYSDVSHEYVMKKGSEVLAAGASFVLLSPTKTMLESNKPVISVTAVRTGAGKSQTTRKVAEILNELGLKTAVIRHPMPYGDLSKQAVQRFATYEDLDLHDCTIEEREEYEPHLARGNIVYAGVDYEKILRQAESEADVILWDGGNNDTSFYKSNLSIVLVDPHRPGHELAYYPGYVNLRMADVVLINKVQTAEKEDIEIVKQNIKESNPKAKIVEAASPITVADPGVIHGKRVLVVEDGPTLTHGEMKYGAGAIAAKAHGAAEIVSPKPFAVRSIKETYEKYSQVENVLPAMGYGDAQIEDLEETINNSDAESVVIATPIDLQKLIQINKPSTRVTYELAEIEPGSLKKLIDAVV